MKTAQITFFIAVSFATSAFQQARAAISITNFVITTNSVSFNISGELPDILPVDNQNALVFVNPNPAASPGFSFYNIGASSWSFTGTQTMYTPFTGNPDKGDFFGANFSGFSAGENILGTFTATWGGTVFDPSVIDSIDVYWGLNFSLPENPSTQPSALTGGRFLTTATVVPEPSVVVLSIFGSVVLLRRIRKN